MNKVFAFGAWNAGLNVIVNTNAIGTTFKNKAEKLNKKLKAKGVSFI